MNEAKTLTLLRNDGFFAHYVGTLSEAGLDDLHLRLLARESNVRKTLLEILSEWVDAAAEVRLLQRFLEDVRAEAGAAPANDAQLYLWKGIAPSPAEAEAGLAMILDQIAAPVPVPALAAPPWLRRKSA